MSRHLITAKGKIISKADQSAIPGLTVEVWDKDLIFDDLVGESFTTDEGDFEITFTGKYFQELFFDRKPDLYFKIFRDKILVHSTEDHILWNVAEKDIDIIIEIDEPGVKPAGKVNRTTISGLIKHADGNAVPGITVRLSQKLFRSQQSLAEGKTNAAGNYTLSSVLKHSAEAIILEILDSDSKVLATSGIIFMPTAKITQNFTLDDPRYKGQSRFEQDAELLKSYLEEAGDSTFSSDDIRFIAGKTRLGEEAVNRWLSAGKLALSSKIAVEALYAFFSQGVAPTAEGITLIRAAAIPTILHQAVAANLVPSTIAGIAEQVQQAWKAFVSYQTLDTKVPGADASIGEIMALAVSDQAMRNKILDAYLNHQGKIEDFWKNLKEVTGSQATVDQLQTTMQLATLAGFQPEVSAALQDEFNKSGSLSTIAQWDKADWVNYINKLSDSAKKSVVPSFIKEDTEEARINAYATTMSQAMALSHPTLAFLGQLKKDDPSASAFRQADMVNFISNNTSFDFKQTPTFGLKSNSKTFNFKGVKDEPALITDLQSTQRLFVYTSDYQAINALKNAGIGSAKDIAQMTAPEFAKKFAGALGSEQSALQIHASAQQQHLRTLNFYLYLRESFNHLIAPQPDPLNITGALGPVVAEADTVTVADLRTMFGSLDTCACEECTSAYSASAYFADILNYLKNAGDGSAYTELVRRRPDILNIKLNCPNTNIILPYVDPAIELMENYILAQNNPGFVDPAYQTTWQPDELAANPEHLNPNAYIPLTMAVYPRVLPFDFFLEESRVYLKHLGVKREELMSVFFAGSDQDAFKDPAIAFERLLISPEEAKIIDGTTKGLAGGGVWNFYGFDLQVNYTTHIVDPATPQALLPTTVDWDDALTGRIDVLLQQTGLSYLDLLALLGCNFINPLIDPARPERQLAIVVIDPTTPQDSCELQFLGLRQFQAPAAAVVVYDQPVDPSFFTKTHRFLRLWKRLGWQMHELDLAITADIDLVRISQMAYLRKQWAMPVDALCAFWNSIGLTAYTNVYQDNNPPIPSLYEQLFVNSAISGIPAFPANPAKVDALGVQLTDPVYLPTILAAFQVNAADLDDLIQYLQNEGRKDFTTTQLTINNLSILYRFTSLTNQLGYTLKDFLALKSLVGIDPFADDVTVSPVVYSPFATFRFLQKISIVSKSGLSISYLNYLLYHLTDSDNPVAPQDSDISTFLLQLLTSVLPLLKAPGNDIFTAITIDINAAAAAQTRLTNDGALVPPDPTLINADQLALQAADNQLNLDQVQLNKLRNTVIQKFSEKLKISATATNMLLGETLISKKFGAGHFLVDDFLDPDFLLADFIEPNTTKIIARNVPPPAAGAVTYSFPNSLFDAYMQLDKLATVINQWKISDEQLRYLLKNSAALGCLDLGSIPPTVFPGTALKPTPAIFDAFEALVKLIQARNLLALPQRNIFDILDLAIHGPNQNAWIAALVAGTGWDHANVGAIAGDGVTLGLLGAAFPADFSNGEILLKIKSGLSVLQKLSCAPAVITTLIQGPDATASTAVKNAAKAKYNDARWRKIAKPLRDVLREKQREALLAYLISHPNPASTGGNWENAEDVYGYFLIDMEMKPINLTSRIKQAICSVQLFIDRVLLNIEGGLSLPQESVTEWKTWRCLYRVWEANRMVLFYPENWIDYTLLDLKTPFFSELETELAQDELSPDNLEDLFNNYLEKLDEVGRLEIICLHRQQENLSTPEAIDRWHIFGRTASHPHKYFHRTLENAMVTPWVRLNIDIDGDHIATTVYNRRLCLVWLLFTKKNSRQNPLTMPATGSQMTNSQKYWQIQVAWSEFKHNKWTPKKLTTDTGIVSRDMDESDLEAYKSATLLRVVVVESTDQLRVIIYNPDESLNKRFVFKSTNDNPTGTTFLTDPIESYTNDAPPNTALNNMMFELQTPPSQSLELDPGNPPDSSSVSLLTLFDHTPDDEIFQLVAPSGESSLFSGSFIYQDPENCFYVEQYLPPKTIPPAQLIFTPALVGFELSQLYQVPVSAREKNTFRLGPGVFPDTGPDLKLGSGIKEDHIIGVDLFTRNRFTFHTFYDPFVKSFIKELNKNGVKGLLTRDMQGHADLVNFSAYAPTHLVIPPIVEPDAALAGDVEVGFTWARHLGLGDAFAQYHWELFFYIPMRISYALFLNQQFDQAQEWIHYVFNPTNSENTSIQRFWQFLPFWDEAGQPGVLDTLDQILRKEAAISEQIQVYMTDPFQPHAIARLRITAYMKNVVMKYLDIIIAKADNLFRSDTIERINEAANLYVLALKILGEKPQKIAARAAHRDYTAGELLSAAGVDGLTDPLIGIDTFIAPSAGSASGSGAIPGAGNSAGPMFYFCIPGNSLLLQYWDTVADRLFKIRNSMNIEGVVRTLPLFEPPIDPALLVRAAAAGIDLNSLLNDITASATPGNYRFTFMLQKALEICNEVKSLGSSLLQALEKRDAEAIALLRSAQEQQLLQAILTIKQSQVDDAQTLLDNANKALEMATFKQQYYANRPYTNSFEQQHLSSIKTGIGLTIAQGVTSLVGSVLAQIPDIKLGVPTTDGETYGGSNLNNLMSLMSNYLGTLASVNSAQGSMAATMGGYDRRRDDWNYLAQMAELEIDAANNSVLSAQIKLAIANKELDNQQLQIDNASNLDDFLHNKFSNQELYDWMVGQVSSVYFQSYQLAYDISKKVEACYNYELGTAPGSASLAFIKFGYWDSLKKGLFAAERLAFDLKQMEASYYEKNVREFELTKHISLAKIDPLALLNFKQTGECMFDLPEQIFDIDYPGHYFRRIKSLSVTIPCVTGPYTTLSCVLTLTGSTVRVNPGTTPADLRTDTSVVTQSIAMSHGQNDSGLFDVSFRDEKYLPFEPAGAISSWHMQLSSAFSQFDYSSISDAIFHLKYCARDGGSDFQNAVKDALSTSLFDTTNPKEQVFARLLSLKQDFPNNFFQLLNPLAGSAQQTTLTLGLTNFPYFGNKAVSIVQSKAVPSLLFIKPKTGSAISLPVDAITGVTLDPGLDIAPPDAQNGSDTIRGGTIIVPKLAAITTINNLQVPLSIPLDAATNAAVLDKALLDDIFILLNYKIG